MVTLVKTNKFAEYAKEEKSSSKKVVALIISGLLVLIGIPALFILITPFFHYVFQNLIGKYSDSLLMNFPWNLIVGLIIGVFGFLYAIWSIITQYDIGKGTPVPMVPTTKLVIIGPYKYSRNPMTFGTIFIYAGLAVAFNSITMLIIIFLFFIIPLLLYIKFIEEEELANRFGEEYIKYREKTSFLLPLPSRVEVD